jgi:hypothetical protein
MGVLSTSRSRVQARLHNVLRRGPSPHLPRHLLFRVLAYRLQAERLGDLDVESRRLLDGAGPPEDAGKRAVDSNRPTAELKPGTMLAREWTGRMHRVAVLVDGFAWNGKRTKMTPVCSAIAAGNTTTRHRPDRWAGTRLTNERARRSTVTYARRSSRSRHMLSRRATIVLVAGSLFSSSLPAFARGASFQAIDSNRDGALDLDEIKKAASAKFDALDRNRTGTLSRREIGRLRLSRKDFAAGDPDKDGTLTKDEYLAIVEQRFKAADTNHKGTLSLAEFNSRAGLPLRRLIY